MTDGGRDAAIPHIRALQAEMRNRAENVGCSGEFADGNCTEYTDDMSAWCDECLIGRMAELLENVKLD